MSPLRRTPYFSVRTGRRSSRLTLDQTKGLFLAAFTDLEIQGYFQEQLGIRCTDGDSTGLLGGDLETFFFRKLRRRNLWPLGSSIDLWKEEDLFDIIELLHDCASKGLEGQYHRFNDCGMHYETFDLEAGRDDFRALINEILSDYGNGYKITTAGEIVRVGPRGLRDLELATRPPGDATNIQERVDSAIEKFKRRGSTLSDRADAIRDLAGILEFLRPKAKLVLAHQDETDLFNIANNFGIRHHNERQKVAYDKAIWLSWMFYYFLATIHATTRLIERDEASGGRVT
jgi:hypothetical protein